MSIVEKYGIDEVWINFDNPLSNPHRKDDKTYLIYRKDAYVGQRELSCANYAIMETFAPSLKTVDLYNYT